MAFNKNFDALAFNAALVVTLETLAGAEKITKETLRSLSREMLDSVHVGGDIQPVNRLLDVLTPMNRSACVEFFKEFSGHYYQANEQKFAKKDKKNYEAKYAAASEFLDDPLNNVWSWLQREGLEVGKGKVFKLENVTKYIERALEQAKEAKIDQADLFKAMVKGGLDVKLIEGILEGMAGQEEA